MMIFVEFAVNFPHNYPRIEYKEKENSTISPFGSINFHYGGAYADHRIRVHRRSI